ncbi:unnamed protein product, partial [Prorocentrum cordatum]
ASPRSLRASAAGLLVDAERAGRLAPALEEVQRTFSEEATSGAQNTVVGAPPEILALVSPETPEGADEERSVAPRAPSPGRRPSSRTLRPQRFPRTPTRTQGGRHVPAVPQDFGADLEAEASAQGLDRLGDAGPDVH